MAESIQGHSQFSYVPNMATDPILTAIQASETTDQLLFELKQLKNAVIGNVARKREVAQNEPLLRQYVVIESCSPLNAVCSL